MFNKHAEYEKRRRTYLACRGVLRIKQADAFSDAVDAANADGDEMARRIYRDAMHDRDARAASIAGGHAGHSAGTDLRNAGSEAGKGFESIGRDMGAGFEHNGGSIEGFGERMGDYIGRGLRGAGENIRQGANYLSNGAYELGRGALGGLRNAGKGLASGLGSIGTGMSNGLDNWMTDLAKHPGANAFGIGTGLSLGYLGHKAGRNIAEALGMDQNGWKAKALRWGLAGLSGLGGYWAGTGIGKGVGKHFARGKAPVDPKNEVPFNPKSIPMSQEELLQKQKAEQEADAAKSGRTGSFGSLNYKKPVQQRNIPGGIERRNIGSIEPRSDAYGKPKK